MKTPRDYGWTEEKADAAEREGWFIAECEGSENGPWQLQRFDEPEVWDLAPHPYPFKEDTDVWEHVVRRAREGSWLHYKAYEVISFLNPKEFTAMQEWVARKQRATEVRASMRTAPDGCCQWFTLCRNQATGTTPHFVLGEVPTCDSCHRFATGKDREVKEQQ